MYINHFDGRIYTNLTDIPKILKMITNIKTLKSLSYYKYRPLNNATREVFVVCFVFDFRQKFLPPYNILFLFIVPTSCAARISEYQIS